MKREFRLIALILALVLCAASLCACGDPEIPEWRRVEPVTEKATEAKKDDGFVYYYFAYYENVLTPGNADKVIPGCLPAAASKPNMLFQFQNRISPPDAEYNVLPSQWTIIFRSTNSVL